MNCPEICRLRHRRLAGKPPQCQLRFFLTSMVPSIAVARCWIPTAFLMIETCAAQVILQSLCLDIFRVEGCKRQAPMFLGFYCSFLRFPQKHSKEGQKLKQPGGLFIEPAFSTFAVFVIDFIPQITVVLHLSQSSISLKSTRVLCTGYVKKTQRHSLFFCAKCSSPFLQWTWRGFCGNCFPISSAKREHASKSCHWARLT